MYYIAIIPKLLSDVESVRKKYDPLAEMVPAHITLFFPSVFEDLEVVLENLRDIVSGINPFTVRLREFTGQDGNLIFLNVKQGNDQIVELHDKLYSGSLSKYLLRKLTFFPHMTVGKIDDESRWVEALEKLAGSNIEQSFIVDRLNVIEITENGDRTVVELLLLGEI